MPRGSLAEKYPVRAAAMARGCRELAVKYREEHEQGMGPIMLTRDAVLGGAYARMSRLEVADSLEAQARRWDHEVETGEPNVRDRRAIGEIRDGE